MSKTMSQQVNLTVDGKMQVLLCRFIGRSKE